MRSLTAPAMHTPLAQGSHGCSCVHLVRRCLFTVGVGVAGLVVSAGPARAGTITQPTGNPFVVPGDAAGNPQPFTIQASGFTQGQLVYVEQCDGTPATTPGWSPTMNCDLGSSPAAAIVDATGAATFAASDPNHAFHPFKGPSPQGLFNCLSPHDPSPNNGLMDFRDCQVRVSSNNSALTADQAFLTLQLPDTVVATTTTTNTTSTTTTTTTIHPTTTTPATSTTTSSTTSTSTTQPSTTTSTSRSSTTTTRPPTTTTTRSTTSTTVRTTSTTVPVGCESAVTFASIDCRLDALIAEVTAADIGGVRALLLRQLDHAKMRKEQAEGLLAEDQTGKGRAALRHAIRWMIDFVYRVNSLTGRRQISATTREMLSAEGKSILDDLQALLGSPAVPTRSPRRS